MNRIPLFVIFAAFIFAGVMWKRPLLFEVRRLTDWRRCASADVVQAENDALRERVLACGVAASVSPSLLRTDVYASYPFNNQNIVLIALGEDEGIRPMMPATIGGEVLVGQVITTFKHSSSVRTIVSPDWRIPVRIGTHKTPGLLMGGPTVRVGMIPADQKITAGDVLIAASRDLPYGLRIGVITSVTPHTEGGVFQEAAVTLGYDLYNLTELDIMVWTPD